MLEVTKTHTKTALFFSIKIRSDFENYRKRKVYYHFFNNCTCLTVSEQVIIENCPF